MQLVELGEGVEFLCNYEEVFFLEINKPIECVLALLDFGSIRAVQLFIKINIIYLIRKLLNSSGGCISACFFVFSFIILN
jgi:hypothetical protein